MEKIRATCVECLKLESQNMEKTNQAWNKIAKELNALTQNNPTDQYFDFFKSKVNLSNKNIIDLGCGTGRHLQFFIEAGARPEGLEPSIEMVKYARQRLEKINKKDIVIHNMGIAEFTTHKKYDYVFISNNPLIGYYENYKRILDLAKEGVFIGSWLDRDNTFFNTIAKELNEVPQSMTHKDLFYLFNLFVADGYYPSFETTYSKKNERIQPEIVCERYTSWIYGKDYNDMQYEKVKRQINKHIDSDGLIPDIWEGIRGMLFVDFKNRIIMK